MIDIGRIAAAALNQARTLLPAWLPEGRWDGVEWRCGDLTGIKGNSCAVNSKSGLWSDFGSGEAGGDLVSLYAAMHGLAQGAAAREVAAQIGFDTGEDDRPATRAQPKPAPKVEKPAPSEPAAPRTDWTPIVPVPPDAGEPPRAHIVRGPPQRRWDYFNDAGQLLGCVYRFVTSDGGKEVLPATFCEHPKGAREWRWMSFPSPRPLYLAGMATQEVVRLRPEKPVLVVEGEKCADAAHLELARWFDVVSWPGGGKAVPKADWTLLAGRRVVLWPDADAKADKGTGELLPASRQPGIVAMRRAAEILQGLGCTVRLVDIPAPGEKPDGWDVADAVADGLTGDALRAWIVERLAEPDAPAAPPKPLLTPPGAGAGGEDGPHWTNVLIERARGKGWEDCRENVMLVLAHHPAWAGVVAYNAFAARTESLVRTPWGTGPGEWTTQDDRELGLWLAQQCSILVRAEGNLSAGVEMAAMRSRYHPVVDYLRAQRWDGVRRLPHWLVDCCGVEDSTYTRMAGTFFLRAMVARVLMPGAQVDHMLVLEGGQGKGKSSALRILGGAWFSDTQLKLGDKDALLGLQNVWLYEVSELDAFSRADVTAVKAFLTTLNDHIRPVYERRVTRRPRQVVMAGSTNQSRYLRDLTGNRRFWPVLVGDVVDTVKLAEWRDQLFAEALHDVEAGERWWPTRDEERTHFSPMQEARVIGDPWLEELPARLDLPKYADTRTFTKAELLAVLGVSADKIDGTGQMARRVEQIMQTLGWRYDRERRPGDDGRKVRPHVYIRPSADDSSASTPVEVPL